MKILITGGNGQLGTALRKALSTHTLYPVDLPDFDVRDEWVVNRGVSEIRPEIIIHCAAYTDVDGCAKNPDLAYAVNGLGTQNVALACRKYDAVLLHISTNEVFAGQRYDGYEEWMTPDPINPYGCSKAAAELFVRRHAPQYYIIRTAWLYAPGGRNFIHAILDRAKEIGSLKVVVDEIGNPTFVDDLSWAVSRLISTDHFGTYHLVNEGACSRWEFANEILRLAGLQHINNQPILGRTYKRASIPPRFGALKNLAGASIGIRLRTWQEALAEFMGSLVLD